MIKVHRYLSCVYGEHMDLVKGDKSDLKAVRW